MKESVTLDDKGLRSAKLSFLLMPTKDGKGMIGIIGGFEIPFSAQSEEGARITVKKLINSLFDLWYQKGGRSYAEGKLEKLHFKKHSPSVSLGKPKENPVSLEIITTETRKPSQKEYLLEIA